jgi:uncharacterized repeat protein (TIGR03803 family)
MKTQTLLRCALLGSAFAFTALSPALAGHSQAEKRALAIHGTHAPAQRAKGDAVSRASARDVFYEVVHDFTGASGAGSGARVTVMKNGDMYGTTDFGGAHGDGVVYKVASDGTESVLYSFTGGTDGSEPDGGVIVKNNGAIFGTAGSGGSGGNGVLFKIKPDGSYHVLHDFSSTDGSFLRGNLVEDSDGSLIGTALFGGINGDGTVFKYAKDGTFTVLHAFNNNDGEFPEHGVAMDKSGNLYGVTAFGGTSGEGTVYKITPDGTFSTVYNFTGGADGGFLYGTVDVDRDGNIYGSTGDGGANGHGTVFKLTPGGTLTTLYNFTGGTDGGDPEGDMLVSGNKLYSTASEGGDPSCQCGGVYSVSMSGHEKMLHAFVGTDGSGYSAGVTARKGLLYGTTASGGAHGDGVVFRMAKKNQN